MSGNSSGMLGEGFSSFLNINTDGGKSTSGQMCEVDLAVLTPSKFQPRKAFNDSDLNELVDSIKEKGILVPLIVRSDQGQFEIVAGERRWRAAKLAGLDKVPVLVRKISDRDTLAIALIENIQRKNLNPLEEAEALQKLHFDFRLSHEEVAKAVGRSRAAVTNLMRLNLLSERAKEYLRKDQISMGHARALLTLEHDEQEEACDQIVSKQLSVRETEVLVRKILFSTNEKQASGRNLVHDPQLEKWSDLIANRFHSAVSIKMSANGGCSMTIKTKSKEELEKIICEFEG